jgi:protein-disulfide isomerase
MTEQPYTQPIQPQPQTEVQAQRAPNFSLGTFLLGAILGSAITFGGVNFLSRPSQAPAQPQSAQSIDLNAIREAAREGAASALASAAQTQSQQQAATPQAQGSSKYTIDYRPANTQGQDNAPITIVEFSDFECGYCKRFNDTTLQQVVDQYVKTGKVKFSYRHYPFLAASSLPKAIVSECAAEQGKFWEMHNVLFGGQIGSGSEQEINAQAIAIAKQWNLDEAKFNNCLSDATVRDRVMKDAEVAQQSGVRGTPTFFVNGAPLVGAQPFAAFQNAITQASR